MTKQEIETQLEPKKITGLYENYIADLQSVYANPGKKYVFKTTINGTPEDGLLTKHNAELGLLLLNVHPEFADEKSTSNSNSEHIVYKEKRYNRLEELLGENAWENAENYNLLIFFFGAEKAACVKYAWERIPYQMYQQGYARRSFRSPNNREIYLRMQMNFIITILPQTFLMEYNSSYNYIYTYYNLSLVEQMKYDGVISTNSSFFRLWSAAIDMGNTAVLQQAESIILNKAEEGMVTRSILKTLLNSEQKTAWQLVEKLLLAAQRQEGLRQTILEALDETSIGALRYMIDVILENNLVRFSSVVRSVDVWAGLGWESEKESTVKSFLKSAQLYLNNTDQIPAAINSQNNMDVYMALWAQGVYDVEATIPHLETLYASGNSEKKCLALLFALRTAHFRIDMPFFYKALQEDDLQVLGAATSYIAVVSNVKNVSYYNTNFPDLFNTLEAVYKRVTIKEKTFSSVVFAWHTVTFSKKYILQSMNMLVGEDQHRVEKMVGYLDEMDADLKRQLSRIVVPKHAAYNYKTTDNEPLTAFQRNYAFLLVKDRSEYDVAYKAIFNLEFTPEELSVFPDMLKRKSPDFRNKIITLLLKQPDVSLETILEPLVLQGDVEQRLAGLDMLLQLKKKNRLVAAIDKWSAAFGERKNISQKENILLEQLASGEAVEDVSAENGYGLFDPENKTELRLPAINPESTYEKQLAAHEYAFSKPFSHIKEALTDLHALFTKYKDHEYEIEQWDNSTEKILLVNNFRKKSYKKEFATPADEFADYPLSEIWEQWYRQWDLQPRDLYILGISKPSGWEVSFPETTAKQLPNLVPVLPEAYFKRYSYYSSPLFTIVQALSLVHVFEQQNEFCLEACVRFFHSFDDKILQYKDDRYHYGAKGWQQIAILNVFLWGINVQSVDEKYIEKIWHLYNWRQYNGLPESVIHSMPALMVFCRAYEAGIISKDALYRGVLTPENIRTLSIRKPNKNQKNYINFLELYPVLHEMMDRIQNHLLNVELKRGDSSTPITKLVSSLEVIYGIHRFAGILAGLGKTTFNRGYVSMYGGGDYNKQQLFSMLLKKCYPLPTDTQKLFNDTMKQIKADEKRLIEAAMYAPQWQKLVSGYLGWKGLDTAIWWMHAHTKTDAYQDKTPEAESEIAKHSAVDVADFKDGAVDKDWFAKAYREIGKERWPLVYDAAKYISDGNGHRRARIYADVMIGALKLKDVTEKVKDKRDQDYLRVYGLVPLAKSSAAKDVLARYEYLQQFKKESRQFGAQKQTSEALAIRVALENLARNAGYPDPVRLTWAMETKQVQEILSKETQVQYDDVLIGLIIDEEGLADLVAFKDDKQLKAIPPKYKKDKKIEELNGYRKTLREQHKRSKKGLEDAMVRGDLFLYSEIKDLFQHPVISKHLEKLIFVTEGQEAHGFYKDGKLVAADKTETALSAKDKLRIAHSTDLYKTGSWAAYQSYAFDYSLQQPFKQIFRELYLPTSDELAEKSISRRYAGHQVQPKQTVALLKNRSWKVDYEEGLQKVFHKEGFVAKMYAMADWFSPADVESPTLETVEFHDLKTGKNIPFDTIEPRIFSEVMRDIDLVVSVAHVGGVDAEASHSSIEMRSVLLKETMRLFKITNVEIKGSHALIKGTRGDYSVHLGSAVVHQAAAGYLSVLPVHSQHRGRLFLPFVDEDPKSAEMISKVLLLARDHEIQDPTILRQLA